MKFNTQAQYDYWKRRHTMAAITKTRFVNAHVPIEPAERVDEIAGRLERSKNWIVKQALSDWIDQEEERSRLTREALADVDAGRVIDHQAVHKWAESLSTNKPLPVAR
jgi:predicted transcriptional regulator